MGPLSPSKPCEAGWECGGSALFGCIDDDRGGWGFGEADEGDGVCFGGCCAEGLGDDDDDDDRGGCGFGEADEGDGVCFGGCCAEGLGDDDDDDDRGGCGFGEADEGDGVCFGGCCAEGLGDDDDDDDRGGCGFGVDGGGGTCCFVVRDSTGVWGVGVDVDGARLWSSAFVAGGLSGCLCCLGSSFFPGGCRVMSNTECSEEKRSFTTIQTCPVPRSLGNGLSGEPATDSENIPSFTLR